MRSQNLRFIPFLPGKGIGKPNSVGIITKWAEMSIGLAGAGFMTKNPSE
jgi:hypothetical protein